jgi:DNA-binding NarL/FixJ family response regulator
MEILPLELLEELQEYHEGLLWVPKRSRDRARRNVRILRLYGRGVATKEIARQVGVTERWVRELLRRRGVWKGKQG